MEIALKATPEELIKKAKALQTAKDVADMLEVPERFLCTILYGIQERKRYRKFEIQKKSNKCREIHAPPKNLSILQKKLSTILTLIYEPKRCVHGFAKGKSIVGNASDHRNKRHIINVDIEDFFPTIHIGRVKGSLKSFLKCGDQAAIVLSQICCLGNGELPQGASTSPIISNLICRSLDNELVNLAKRNGCMYTRYADDITFSTNLFTFPTEIADIQDQKIELSDGFRDIFKRNSFALNEKKTSYYHRLKRQEVTGLTVNEFPNVDRNFVRSILGSLHAWQKYGYEAANKRYHKHYICYQRGTDLANVIWGKILFLKMVLGEDSPLFRKIAREFNGLSSGHKIKLKSICELEPSPSRGEIPKEGGWKIWFDRYKDSVAFIKTVDKNSDQGTATAFYIGKGLFATALHNLKYLELKLYVGDDQIDIAAKWPDYKNDTEIDVAIIKAKVQPTINPILSQMRLPEIGEEVAAIGYPVLPGRQPTIVMHTGIVEALPACYKNHRRFIQVSFQGGGGLSGGVLIDKRGFAIGVMTENIFQALSLPTGSNTVDKPYGQATPIECLYYLFED